MVGNLAIETVLDVDGVTVKEAVVSYLGTSSNAQVIDISDRPKIYRYLFEGDDGAPVEVIDNRDQRNVTLAYKEQKVSCELALSPVS